MKAILLTRATTEDFETFRPVDPETATIEAGQQCLLMLSPVPQIIIFDDVYEYRDYVRQLKASGWHDVKPPDYRIKD